MRIAKMKIIKNPLRNIAGVGSNDSLYDDLFLLYLFEYPNGACGYWKGYPDLISYTDGPSYVERIQCDFIESKMFGNDAHYTRSWLFNAHVNRNWQSGGTDTQYPAEWSQEEDTDNLEFLIFAMIADCMGEDRIHKITGASKNFIESVASKYGRHVHYGDVTGVSHNGNI